jgi:conjugal transfer ATP-binding protein TraC
MLLCASLPFGLYATPANMENLLRDFVANVPAVVPTIPVQADFAGAGKVPKLLFVGRKGQIAGLDFFDRDAPNHNCLLLGSSGSGKSFFINNVAFSYHSTGALVRIIDIGRSYLKLSKMIPGARFLDFTPHANISLNPFTFIQEPEEELKSVAAVIAQMAFANSPRQSPTDIQFQLFQDAVRWAWKTEGASATVDTVHSFLHEYPKLGAEVGLNGFAKTQEIIDSSHTLAYQLKEFTSEGAFAKFFHGPSTFDIRSDEFVVLELEALKAIPALYRVITLQVINAVTQDLYLSDRSRERLCIFDESWQFLSESGGGGSQMLSPVISEGYRRSRKYNGSFLVVSQSLLDIPKFGEVGDIINGNSAFKIYLESSDMGKARELGLIDYDDFTLNILKSLKSKRPKYSEMFVDSPFGRGCLRLAVDDYAYYVCTSDAKEYAQIERLVAQGSTYDQAIRIMAAERAKGH